ncbi:aminoacyl-tRNA hydrolase [Tepidimonas sp. HKU79]|uniref:aminoacyl-tRNA hydrolase n=1 Tax=unclassified Tepidimonas TaxID=2631705 RepID=UPI003C7BCC3B
MIKLLVGLGNPGPEYEDTRHNAGWWWIDRVAQDLRVTLHPERAYFGLVGRTQFEGQPLWLLKPTTYMNRSGQAVAALARFFKIAPEHILVAHDELDLPPGDARLKRGGGHAGHNGLRDIHAQLGSADYWRLRLGIGHPGVKAEVVHWVLRKPPLEQRQAIDAAIERAARALPSLLAGDVAKATSAIHTSQPPRAKPPRPSAADQRPPSSDAGEHGAAPR